MTTSNDRKRLTTADVVRVVGLELRLAWTVAAKAQPRTNGYHGELFRVAALVADLSTGYEWTILVGDGFHAREASPGLWSIFTGVRIEPSGHAADEAAAAEAVLQSVAALL